MLCETCCLFSLCRKIQTILCCDGLSIVEFHNSIRTICVCKLTDRIRLNRLFKNGEKKREAGEGANGVT